MNMQLLVNLARVWWEAVNEYKLPDTTGLAEILRWPTGAIYVRTESDKHLTGTILTPEQFNQRFNVWT